MAAPQLARPVAPVSPRPRVEFSRKFRSFRVRNYELSLRSEFQFAAVRLSYVGAIPSILWETGIFRRLFGYRITAWAKEQWYKERSWMKLGV